MYLVIIALGVSITSCKKYDKCCKFTAYDETNDQPYEKESCRSDMSKKELEEFESNNTALKNYEKAKASGPVYWTNTQYSCE